MGVASLVLGIIALLISIGAGAAGMGWIGSICAVLAIIFELSERRNRNRKEPQLVV